MGEDVLNLCDAAVELGLLVFGLVVFAVLREVAERPGLLDLLCYFLFAGRLQIKKLLLQLLEAERTDLEFFCHVYDRSFHNRSGGKRLVFTVIQQTLYRAKMGMSREFLGDFADCGL